MVVEELFTRLGFQVDPKGIDKAKSSLSSFKKWVGGLALGAGLVSLTKTGLDAAMTIEGLTTDFEVMSGSAEKANNLLGEIAAFAAKTPFDKLGLSGAAKTLMAFGIESEKVLPTLKMLGDVSLGDQNKLNGLALVFGQIQSTGKLMGQDLLQLINQGFNPLTEISKKTGISVSDLKDAMAKGAISADMVTEAFKSATSAGGLFYNGLEKRSETLAGKISTLKDNFVTALQNMAEAFLPLLKAGTDMLVAFDWSPVVGMVQAVGAALAGIPFDKLVANVRRLSFLVVLFATRDLDKVLAGSLKAALARGVATFKGLELSFVSFKTIAVSGIKSIAVAMKTALGPIGIALMAIEGFIEAYNWLKGRSEREATEKELESARTFFKNKQFYERKTKEQTLDELERNLAKKREEAAVLQEEAKKPGVAGRAASEKLKEVGLNIKDREKFLGTLKQVYTEETGLDYASKPWEWGVKNPGLAQGVDLSVFEDLEKAVKDNTKETKKNTKAKEKPPFDITALSRQAFDAAFNVKLRELTLGTI